MPYIQNSTCLVNHRYITYKGVCDWQGSFVTSDAIYKIYNVAHVQKEMSNC